MPSGWGNGKGEIISREVISKTLEIYHIGKNYAEYCEVFPVYDGSMKLSFCSRKYYTEFLILPNLVVTYSIGYKETKYNTIEEHREIDCKNLNGEITKILKAVIGEKQ